MGGILGLEKCQENKVMICLKFLWGSLSQFAHACRSHWLIENQLHWVLDVSMNEDNSQIYRENAAANLASIRHMSLNMLRQDTSRKLSVPRKKRALMMDPSYLDAVITAGIGAYKK